MGRGGDGFWLVVEFFFGPVIVAVVAVVDVIDIVVFYRGDANFSLDLSLPV